MAAASPQTIAVTGATGFVGSRFLKRAVQNGLTIRALTRKKRKNEPAVTWIHGALDNSASLNALCDGADALVHIAGVVNAPDWQGFEAGNIAGTQSVVDAASEKNIPRLLHISSLAATQPQLSDYGRSKAEAERIVKASGQDWTIIRPPAIYGPGDTEMLDLFKMARFGVLTLPPVKYGKLSVIHVDDLCEALLAMLPSRNSTASQIFEVDDGKPGSWIQDDFAQAIGRAVGRDIKTIAIPKTVLNLAAKIDRLTRGEGAKLTADRVRYFCYDDWSIDPARRPAAELWQPQIDTAQGLKETAAWYRQEGWLQ